MTATLVAAPAPPAHRDPQVLRWLGAYTASTLGDSVYHLALSWAAVRGGTPAEAGLVMAVSAVPRALLMLGGGVIADRFGPRRVVIVSDTVRCLVVLAVAALVLVAAPTLWVLAGIALVFGIVDALFLPAVGALPPRIAPHDQLARVQGMRGLAQRSGAVLGAPSAASRSPSADRGSRSPSPGCSSPSRCPCCWPSGSVRSPPRRRSGTAPPSATSSTACAICAAIGSSARS